MNIPNCILYTYRTIFLYYNSNNNTNLNLYEAAIFPTFKIIITYLINCYSIIIFTLCTYAYMLVHVQFQKGSLIIKSEMKVL